MSERRKLERLSPLVIKTQFPSGGELRHGYMTNLSESGAFLATDEEIAVGEVLDLHFVLPWGLGEHDAKASVVWKTGCEDVEAEKIPVGVGLSFNTLDAEVTESIRRYMQRFHELLEQIEERGLNEALANFARGMGSSNNTVH
jgi:hypothetical protein